MDNKNELLKAIGILLILVAMLFIIAQPSCSLFLQREMHNFFNNSFNDQSWELLDRTMP